MSSRVFFHTLMGGSAKSYFLDDFPILDGGGVPIGQAYSLRKLSSTYTGNCIKVREDQTNQELEFGFVDDVLDIAGIEAFLAANGNANGFVTKIYEQSDAFNLGAYPIMTIGTPPNDLSGGTLGSFVASSQMQIAANGVVYTHNGHPYIRDVNKPYLAGIVPDIGGNGWLGPWGVGGSYSSFNINFYDATVTNAGSFGGAGMGGGQTASCMQFHPAGATNNPGPDAHLSFGSGGDQSTYYCMGSLAVDLNDKIHIATDIRVPGSGTSYFNLDSITDCSTTAPATVFQGGFRLAYGKFQKQPYFMEWIYYQVEKTPAEIAAIEASIMEYYEIP